MKLKFKVADFDSSVICAIWNLQEISANCKAILIVSPDRKFVTWDLILRRAT